MDEDELISCVENFSERISRVDGDTYLVATEIEDIEPKPVSVYLKKIVASHPDWEFFLYPGTRWKHEGLGTNKSKWVPHSTIWALRKENKVEAK